MHIYILGGFFPFLSPVSPCENCIEIQLFEKFCAVPRQLATSLGCKREEKPVLLRLSYWLSCVGLPCLHFSTNYCSLAKRHSITLVAERSRELTRNHTGFLNKLYFLDFKRLDLLLTSGVARQASQAGHAFRRRIPPSLIASRKHSPAILQQFVPSICFIFLQLFISLHRLSTFYSKKDAIERCFRWRNIPISSDISYTSEFSSSNKKEMPGLRL